MYKIQTLRKKYGISQAELAKRAGISEISIRKYESGERSPKIETLSKIAAALQVPLYALYDDIEKFHFNPKYPPAGMIQIGEGDNSMLVDAIQFQQTFNNIVQKCCPNQTSNLLDKFYQLNFKGRDKALDQISLLTKIPEYQKDFSDQKEEPDNVTTIDLAPSAAHAFNPSEEEKKRADDIMKDDSNWD